MGYLDFVGVVDGAALVMTDSGGIQEETSVLGVPCLTLRENTERPRGMASCAYGPHAEGGRGAEGLQGDGMTRRRGA